MKNRIARLSILACALLVATVAQATMTRADDEQGIQFIVLTPGAYLRNDPSLVSPNTYPVFQHERYAILGRTSDNLWVQLAYPEATKGAWIMSPLGSVQGDLESVPVPKLKSVPRALLTRGLPKVAGVPTISASARAIYQAAVAAGRNPYMFTVIGDCNSQPTAYIGRLAAGLYDFSRYSAYQATVSRFTWSWPRISLAASGGFNAPAVLDPLWADDWFCQKDETPLACELRVSNASILLLELGTGDTHVWRDFEGHYRQIVSYALEKGVLPVLITKADALESQEGDASPGYINDVIRNVGAELGLPVMDFWQATRNLPNYGLIDEGNSDFHLAPGGSDLHLLMTLQTLDAIWRK